MTAIETSTGDKVFQLAVFRDARERDSRKLIDEHTWSERDQVTERLNELCGLPKGWDGYGAPPVSFHNAHFALQLLDGVCRSATPPPQIVPGVDGDLQIEWHTEGGDIELHLISPNNIHAWRHIQGGDPDGEDLNLKNNFANVRAWVRDLLEPASATEPAAA